MVGVEELLQGLQAEDEIALDTALMFELSSLENMASMVKLTKEMVEAMRATVMRPPFEGGEPLDVPKAADDMEEHYADMIETMASLRRSMEAVNSALASRRETARIKRTLRKLIVGTNNI